MNNQKTKRKKLFTLDILSPQDKYLIFDGEKQLEFSTSSKLLDYLGQERKTNELIIFSKKRISLKNLWCLIQEALKRDWKSLPKGKSDDIAWCHLDSKIVIKDINKFGIKTDDWKEKSLEELYHYLKKIDKQSLKEDKKSIINDCFSLSSLVWSSWLSHHERESKKFDWGKDRIWCINREEDEFIRKSYLGGYLDLFNDMIYRGEVTDLDFKNFYPAEMARHFFPIDKPFWVNHPKDLFVKNKRRWKERFYGFFECEVECLPNNPFPFFLYKNEDGINVYREGKFKAVLFSEEIKFYWKYTPLIKVTVGQGYSFCKRKRIFCDWVRKLYKKQEEGDELAKMKMRVLYGKFGVPKSRHELVWSKERNLSGCKDFLDKDKSLIYLATSPKPVNNWGFSNVAIASAITSYGRIKSYKFLVENWEKLQDNILYWATDGFVIKGNWKPSDFKYDKPTIGRCGDLLVKGKYQGFFGFAPNNYAFLDNDKKTIVGRGLLKEMDKNTSENLIDLLSQRTNEKTIKERFEKKNTWSPWIKDIIESTYHHGKKRLVDGKWTIIKENQTNL